MVGLALLEAYLRLVTAGMRALGITIAPLICGLVALTLLLLLVPPLERALSKLLKPAVDAVDAQIACIFVPYITAVPISNLPAGEVLWTAIAVCSAGYLATMLMAGYAAQITASLMGRGDVVEKCDVEVDDVDDTTNIADDNAANRQKQAAAAAAPPPEKTSPTSDVIIPMEIYWLGGAAILAPLGVAATTHASVPAAIAAAPSYLCVTFAVYLLCRRIPAKLQRLGLFPTITAGVAMAFVAALAGVAGIVATSSASASAAVPVSAPAVEPWAAGIQLYMKGAGAALLYFVPPAVLGLAFRVHAQRAVLAANALPLAAALSLSVPGGLLLAACLGRLAGLPAGLVLASLPKCTTTGLAVSMAAQLGVEPSLVAAGCALSGTIGLAGGRTLMDLMRVNGPVARGVATGTSSHAAGTAALAAGGEDGAAAVSGVSFALAGVMGVLLLETAPFRALLFVVAGGG